MYIHRILEKKVKKLAKEYPIIAVTGPRQSGKTTMVRKLFPEKSYVSLENIDIRNFASSDPRGFLETYSKGAILDEIQNVPELFSYLQEIVDTDKKMGAFILTGSQNFLLMEKINQSLAGRVAIIILLPLSVRELEKATLSKHSLESHILKGMYPRIYETKIEHSGWYQNYIKTYIERDVRMIKNIGDLAVFQKFMQLCANRVGQILNLSSIANDLGVSHNTIKEWISILEASYIIFLLQPYHNNFNKRLIKMPKIYFYDMGVLSTLLKINSKDDLESHPFKGGIFESFVISEVFKNNFNAGKTPSVYFWRDKTGHEIDCLIEESNRKIAVEIKSAKTIGSDFFVNLDYLQKISDNLFDQGVLVYNGIEQKRSNYRVLDWKKFLVE
ncbi:MAG: hypothetical protein ACD_7C00266G0013 [uncultured bacterium]|nr:MAG: hypothetical protein ACD_7C00266G0013 [uncultured bacterium]HBR79454.1 AAA family ATPase [Candidatus Moranbacteria bacterium]